MQFTLHYDGSLPSRGSAEVKHRIRSALEPQLREIWELSPLAGTHKWLDPAIDGDLTALHNHFGRTFASIVSSTVGMAAELDILMLRPSPPGEIVHRGDIDNRLKTLLDALSAPAQQSQMTDSMRDAPPTDPIYVLLDDDNLITRLNIEAERLLAPRDPNDVRLTIRVTTRIIRHMIGNFHLT